MEEVKLLETKHHPEGFRSVDPRKIHIESGFNTRIDFDLDELIESIIQNGIVQPIHCYHDKKNDQYWVIDGERRYRAIMQIYKQRNVLVTTPVIVIKKPDEKERTFMLISKNDGKQLTPYEQAITYKRLIDYGYTTEAISAKLGKSDRYIRQTIQILSLPAPVLDEVIKGNVSAFTVLKEIKKFESVEDFMEYFLKQKQKQQEIQHDQTPKQKVTKSGSMRKNAAKPKDKKVKIEIDAQNAEKELLKSGVKKQQRIRVVNCGECPFAAINQAGEGINVYCNPVMNKSIESDLDVLEITQEFNNEKMSKDCPLRTYQFMIEIMS